MSRIVFAIFFCSIFFFSCGEEGTMGETGKKVLADTASYTDIQWEDSVVSFGHIKMGEEVMVRFRFRNTGKHPLFLTNVKAGCGCTVPDYTKGAIAPGATGEVTGAFNSKKAAEGEVRKAIFVTTNTHGKTNHTLIFTGLVNAEKQVWEK